MTESPAELSRDDALLVLNGLPGVGPVMLRRLLDWFGGDPLAILKAAGTELVKVRGVGPKAVSSIRSWNDGDWLERERKRLQDHGARFITLENEDFPRALLETFDPPIGLYCRGTPPKEPCVSIVGTRRPSLYGLRMAEKLSAGLARAGFCIVSGMARGIDAAAHEGALGAGGKTVAVFGCGIDVIYPPEHLDLFRRIVESGAVFSEFSFGRRADRQTFPMRNRLVAGMSAGVIVVESAANGGSLITARFAGEQGRQVFAVPGRVDQSTAEGCNQLIREGATLVTSASEVVDELAPALNLAPVEAEPASSKDAVGNLSPGESAVYGSLSEGALMRPDAIADQAGLPVHEVMSTLTLLELKRLVCRHSDGSFEAR